jgi:hypothetical protein
VARSVDVVSRVMPRSGRRHPPGVSRGVRGSSLSAIATAIETVHTGPRLASDAEGNSLAGLGWQEILIIVLIIVIIAGAWKLRDRA